MQIEFPSREEAVHIQTHTSHVFLVGDDVYKVKKPVDFSFLDYSTLEKRKACCEKEVEMNRRFSPDVYRGVLPLFDGGGGRLAFEGEGEPVEYAVHMRRLPQEAMLARRLAAGDVREDEMVALAELLGRFYEGADQGAAIANFGSPDQIRENTVENFDTTEDFEEELLPDLCRRFLRAANERFLAERTGLLLDRVAGGRIVDGHGDLKPENLFLTESGPVVTDCIEFNDRFRYGDVLVDLAYLTMGLREAGREDLREAFLGRYRRFEPDYPEELLDYYEIYRAVVKGKIEGFRARQEEVPAPEREEARAISLRHFHLARRIALGHRPVLVVLCGVTGSGKSALAPALVSGLGAGRAESDRIRKDLAELPHETRVEVPYGVGLYSPEMSAKTYAEMRRRAAEALAVGQSFVLDATHLTREDRATALAAADGTDAIRAIVAVTATEEQIAAHDAARGAGPGASDGRPEIRAPQRDRYEAPSPAEADVVLTLEAAGSLAETRARLAAELGEALARMKKP